MEEGMEDFRVLAGTANPALAAAIAAELSVPLAGCRIERFPDGEISAELEESVRHHQIFIVQPTAPPVNDHLIELAAVADACRRAAAKGVVGVVPYFGYARGDRRKSRRTPIMARAAADLLEASGVQHLVTLDLHSPQVEGFFHIPVEGLTAIPILAVALRDQVVPETVIVAPDLGAIERASELAERLGCSVAVLPKRRLSGTEVEVRQLIGDVEDRPCLILDDMISTGGTILKAVEALHQAGARPQIRVAATHGVFAEGAREGLMASGLQEIVVTDSVAIPDGDVSGLRRLTIAPLLATALRRLAVGESLRDLF
jgi:ribose-phosphate pyrophosphokinase